MLANLRSRQKLIHYTHYPANVIQESFLNLSLQKEPSPLHKEFCEGLIGNIPVAFSLPDSVVCGTCDNYMHDMEEMESNEDLKLYDQPLPSAGEEGKNLVS